MPQTTAAGPPLSSAGRARAAAARRRIARLRHAAPRSRSRGRGTCGPRRTPPLPARRVRAGRVDDEAEVVVALDLRALVGARRVLDRELVQAEVRAQLGHLLVAGLLQLEPDEAAAPARNRGGLFETQDRRAACELRGCSRRSRCSCRSSQRTIRVARTLTHRHRGGARPEAALGSRTYSSTDVVRSDAKPRPSRRG